MSNTGFKRWGATSGASGASSYGHSRSDGTQYKSPSEEAKKTTKKPKTSSPKPGKAAVAYGGSSSPSQPKSSPSSSPSVVKSTPAPQTSGLAPTTYEKQPDWAYSEREKNATGQYRDGMFQGSDNPNNASVKSTKPVTSSYHSSGSSSSTTSSYSSSPKPSYASAATKSYSSPKPAVTSYRVGGTPTQSSYGSSTGVAASGGVTQSGLAATTYEKQPDWAYAERSKNAHGQYKDGMFQGGNKTAVNYSSSSVSPSELKSTGKLR